MIDSSDKRWYRNVWSFHKSCKSLSILIVVSDFIGIVEVEILEVGEMLISVCLWFNIIFLIKFGHFVWKSYSFYFIIENVVITREGTLIVLLSNCYSWLTKSIDRNNPLKYGILAPSYGSLIVDDLIKDGIKFYVVHELLSSNILYPTFIWISHHSCFGFKSQIDPAVKHEEDRMSDGELRVTHESLKIVVHSVVTIFHAVFVVLIVSRDIILEKVVWFLEESLSILKMRKCLIIGVRSCSVCLTLQFVSFLLWHPVKIFLFWTEKSIDLVFI